MIPKLLLVSSLAWPLLIALASLHGKWRPQLVGLLPFATVPSLLLAWQGEFELSLPWLLMGLRLGIDPVNSTLVLLAALVWTAASLFAYGWLKQQHSDGGRFLLLFLLSLVGNLGVMLALDAISFYGFFALMAFAAYGLIVHEGSAEARQAGRIYLILTIIGEALLLMALWLIIGASTSPNIALSDLAPQLAIAPQRDLIIGLVLVSFAIKMGSVPLHVWLPASYRCAPIAASAVLGGAMIKAGLLGWMRFLPLGQIALPAWGELCLVIGLGSAFYGALVGSLQIHAKTVVAYSSISQMGLLTALLGIALTAPDAWPLVLNILLLFSLHHGLAKAALFFGVDITRRGAPGSGWLLVLPALALAGAPLTSGALAKLALSDVVILAPGRWTHWLPMLLVLSSAATTLLMTRMLYLAWPRQQGLWPSSWLWAPWLGLLVAGLAIPWWWSIDRLDTLISRALDPEKWLASLAILAGASMAAGCVWGLGRITRWRPTLPEGDILVLLVQIKTFLVRPQLSQLAQQKWPEEQPFSKITKAWTLLYNGERSLRYWRFAGLGFMTLGCLLAAFLAFGRSV